ncbi:MAG: 3-dehydroquinate synthase [Verrucomicrobiae bacterium]|nr:3-dehydroquinate synthase [Verrucomicrobiae bacterium]
MSVTVIPVRLGARSHEILVGEGLLPSAWIHRLRDVSLSTRFFVVADRKLARLARAAARFLGARCAGLALLPGGEATKDLPVIRWLWAEAARRCLDRRTVVVVIGGGVLGDAVGFFSATYLRGLRVVQAPTTLMAQVDSAIGGKTGINLPVGKNLVGAFHQPSLVIADPGVLATLPTREFRAGLAEVVKYGVIADAALFLRLERHAAAVLARDPSELRRIIVRCAAIKARVISLDEREMRGLRATLNFGHTIGHALEAATRYGALMHGEAVALGIVAATGLSQRFAGLPARDAERIVALIARLGLPVRLPSSARRPLDKILAALRLDKKATGGRPRFVLAQKIGRVITDVPVPLAAIRAALRELDCAPRRPRPAFRG